MSRIICVASSLLWLTLGWASTSAAQAFADADCGKPIGYLGGIPARSNASDTTSKKDCGEKPAAPDQLYPTTSIDGDPFQCTEYVRRYYRAALGVNSQAWPKMNANEFFTRHAELGLDQIPNGNAEPPRVSDIVVFGHVPANAGHVAIVKEVIGDRVKVIEQNWSRDNGEGELRRRANSSGWDLYRVLNSGAESGYKVLGWLRSRAVDANFTDPVAFQAALTQQSTITFDGLASNTPIANGTSIDGVTYTFNVADGFGGLATNFYLAVSPPNTLGVRRDIVDSLRSFFFAGDSVTLTFAQPIRAIGAYFSSNPAAGTAQEFIFISTPVGTAFSGDALPAGTFGFEANSLRFVGLVSSTPFSQATLAITNPSPGSVGFVADNIIIGR